MKKALIFLALVYVCGHASYCQAQPFSIAPPDGHVFLDQDRLCLVGDAAPGRFSSWWIASPNGSGALITPFIPSLDNGYCFPGQVEPWDSPVDFSLSYQVQGSEPRQVNCEIRPSDTETPPEEITFKEVSFTRKNNKYYLRLTVLGLLSETACLQVQLGESRLAITRNKASNGLTVVEAVIGKEDDFVHIASNTPAIALSDTCLARRSSQRFLPVGKYSWVGSMLAWNTSNQKVRSLGVWWTPLTGCEVVFYSWYDPTAGDWTIRNFPTYIKYNEHSDSTGYLPPSYRKVLSGTIIWRAYDYCTGEFAGWGMGGNIPAELGKPLEDGTRVLNITPESLGRGYAMQRAQEGGPNSSP
jgi:hypothetical protein